MDESIEAQGEIIYENNSTIRSPVKGLVEEVFVKEGQAVNKGDTLVKIKTDEFEIRYHQALRNLSQAREGLLQMEREYALLKNYIYPSEILKVQEELHRAELKLKKEEKNYKRGEQLLTKKLISMEEFEQLEYSYKLSRSTYEGLKSEFELLKRNHTKSLDEKAYRIAERRKDIEDAEENLNWARRELEMTTILSPLKGVVLTQKPKEIEGKMIKRGDALLDIAEPDKLVFLALIREEDVPKIKIGNAVNLYLKVYPYRKYGVLHGSVVCLLLHRKSTNKSITFFEVKIRIDEPWVTHRENHSQQEILLIPGMKGKAKIIIEANLKLLDLIFKKWLAKHE